MKLFKIVAENSVQSPLFEKFIRYLLEYADVSVSSKEGVNDPHYFRAKIKELLPKYAPWAVSKRLKALSLFGDALRQEILPQWAELIRSSKLTAGHYQEHGPMGYGMFVTFIVGDLLECAEMGESLENFPRDLLRVEIQNWLEFDVVNPIARYQDRIRSFLERHLMDLQEKLESADEILNRDVLLDVAAILGEELRRSPD